MDSATLNKAIERNQIERFAKLLGFSKEDIFYPDTDPPDALIKTNCGIISLEHTRIIHETDRAIETIKKKCIRQAKIQWTKAELPAIRVDVVFNEPGPVSYSQIDQYSDRIQNMIFNFVGPLHDLKSRFSSDRVSCYAARSMVGSRNHWTCVDIHIGWVRRISDSSLQDKIFKKNRALTRYYHKSNEVWLLLFIESEYASSMYSLETQYKHESDFDKVFISDGFKYVELINRRVQGD